MNEAGQKGWEAGAHPRWQGFGPHTCSLTFGAVSWHLPQPGRRISLPAECVSVPRLCCCLPRSHRVPPAGRAAPTLPPVSAFGQMAPALSGFLARKTLDRSSGGLARNTRQKAHYTFELHFQMKMFQPWSL